MLLVLAGLGLAAGYPVVLLPGKLGTAYVVPELVPRAEALAISAQALELADQQWAEDRHCSFSSRDIDCMKDVEELPFLEKWTGDIWATKVRPALASSYGLAVEDLLIEDLFVARYDAGKRDELANHRDSSLLSFSVLLSDETAFDGGATYFDALGASVPLRAGDALLHCGEILHGGSKTTRGTRLILVGFVQVIADNVDEAIRWESTRDLGRLAQLERVHAWLGRTDKPMIYKSATPAAVLKATRKIDANLALKALR
ncbi:hypothetical protein M885DRAFT_524735 [Pelagophyceae sp. CCMP2097]|nr:hypothetical protein M885DRAFT_524735 [Pelagophyceae sp. CCMP2097]